MGSIGPGEIVILLLIIAMFVGMVLIVGGIIYAATRRRGGTGLIKCAACGRDVSVRATTCPHCGDPLGNR
jgi:hypothetical protein